MIVLPTTARVEPPRASGSRWITFHKPKDGPVPPLPPRLLENRRRHDASAKGKWRLLFGPLRDAGYVSAPSPGVLVYTLAPDFEEPAPCIVHGERALWAVHITIRWTSRAFSMCQAVLPLQLRSDLCDAGWEGSWFQPRRLPAVYERPSTTVLRWRVDLRTS